MKRFLDIFLSGIAILFFLPFFIPIMIILKFTGEGEIFYFQDRVGKNRKIFKLYKFATMLKNSPNMTGGDITFANDPRVLKIGKFLRKTKINELPQIINVLKGDMSIVGPRPITVKNFSYYSDEVQNEIKKLQPGLTGIGSVIFRDEESIIGSSKKDVVTCYKEDIAPYKGALEVWYSKKKCLSVDLKLIFLTAWSIVFPKSDLYKLILKGLPERNSIS